MRRIPILAAAILALSAAPPVTPAAAQDAAAEILRKAKAGEKDNGFCAGAGFEKLEYAQITPRLNQVLTQSKAEVRMTVAVFKQGETTTVCFLFVFAPPAPRDGKNCRATETYSCVAGADCKVLANDHICEVRPGEWD